MRTQSLNKLLAPVDTSRGELKALKITNDNTRPQTSDDNISNRQVAKLERSHRAVSCIQKERAPVTLRTAPARRASSAILKTRAARPA